MENTPNLDLPYIMPSQAQKHVTHNEALDALDALVQLSVIDRDLASPPASPVEGDRYIVGAAATGDWAGQEEKVAVFRDAGWLCLSPRVGWVAFVADEEAQLYFDGAAWRPLAGGTGETQNLPLLGVGTVADAENPFAAKVNKALWTAREVTEGGDGDLRFTMNKETSANTTSVLFQSGYSGRAEIGLTGTDNLSVKVSPDGSTWHQAWSIDSTNGMLTLAGATRFDGAFGIGRNPAAVGGLYFNRSTDNPFLLFSAGDPEGATNIGQFRASAASSIIGITNPTGATYGVCYKVGTGVGIMTSAPENTLSVNGIAAPQVDNAYSFGTAARRWSVVYAATGTINTSDARDKDVEARLGAAAARIVDAVEPVLYRWKVGGMEQVEIGVEQVADGEDIEGNPLFIERPVTEDRQRPGVRLHAGWVAQDVKAALDAEGIDCGAWGLDTPGDAASRQWLRPDQLVAFLWEALRQTRKELRDLAALQPA